MRQRSGSHIKTLLIGALALAASAPAAVDEMEVFQPAPGLMFRRAAVVPADSAASSSGGGFRVAAATQDITPQLEAYQQHIDAGQWEKAFAVLADLGELQPPPMVRASEHLILPLGELRRRLLLSLPEDGRRAFGLFHQPKAQALLDAAIGAGEELPGLRAVYEQYPITSAGELAADRLGDALFETGDFRGAAACWSALLKDHAPPPDRRARLLAKLATALARGGEHRQFEQVAAALAANFVGERITLGGRETPVPELLAALRESLSATPTHVPPEHIPRPPRLKLPREVVWSWSFEVLDQPTQQQINASVRSRGYPMDPLADFQTQALVDGSRLLLHAPGITAALDAATGKELWRTVTLQEMLPRMAQMAMYGMLDRHWLEAHGDALLVLSPDSKRMPASRLSCLEPASGKVRWSDGQQGVAGQYLAVGRPLVLEGGIYLAAIAQPNRSMVLLALDPAQGQPKATITLGDGAADLRTGGTTAQPRLAHAGGVMYVLTNDGAVVAVDLREQRVAWALSYPVNPPPVGRLRGAFPGAGAGAGAGAGEITVAGGILCFSDARSDYLQGWRVADMTRLWQVELNSGDSIIGFDQTHAYVLGQELAAYEISTGRKKWWSDLLGEGGGQPLMTREHMYLCGARGVLEFELATGKVTGWLPGIEPAAGRSTLLHAGKHLIRVSSTAVHAYALPEAAEAP